MPRRSNKRKDGREKGGFFKRRFDSEAEEFSSEFEFEEEEGLEAPEEETSFASAFSEFAPEFSIPDGDAPEAPDAAEPVLEEIPEEEVVDEVLEYSKVRTLSVTTAEKKHVYVPFKDGLFIKNVDIDNKVITINVMEGLL